MDRQILLVAAATPSLQAGSPGMVRWARPSRNAGMCGVPHALYPPLTTSANVKSLGRRSARVGRLLSDIVGPHPDPGGWFE
jgi:hypothetical protein